MHRLIQARAARRALAGLLALSLFEAGIGLPAVAALANKFAVSAAQMQALGIALLKLDRPGPIRGMAYPAKVVLPPSGEQVVSAAVDGVVARQLVSSQQAVKAGQPILN